MPAAESECSSQSTSPAVVHADCALCGKERFADTTTAPERDTDVIDSVNDKKRTARAPITSRLTYRLRITVVCTVFPCLCTFEKVLDDPRSSRSGPSWWSKAELRNFAEHGPQGWRDFERLSLSDSTSHRRRPRLPSDCEDSTPHCTRTTMSLSETPMCSPTATSPVCGTRATSSMSLERRSST